MRKTRTLIVTAILVVVLGLLTVSMALAGEGLNADSLASVTGDSSNPSGESVGSPDLGGVMLLDQQPDQSNGIFADTDCDACAATGMQSMAENFILSNTYTINRIVIWSGYFPNNSMPPDDLTVLFHNDNSGNIGTNISSESNVPSSRMQTGVVLFGVNEWMTVMTLTNPVELTAGTYWVEIFNNTAGNTDSYFWEVGTPDPVNGTPNDVMFSTSTPGATWNVATGGAALATQIWGTVPNVPNIAISKSPASQNVTTNGNADFTITVTNTGDVDLANVNVSDPLVADCDNTIGALTISQTVSYACQDVGVSASYTNVATVTSQLVTGGPGPSASASAVVNYSSPTSVSVSGFGEDAVAFSPIWLVAVLAVILGAGFLVRRKLTA